MGVSRDGTSVCKHVLCRSHVGAKMWACVVLFIFGFFGGPRLALLVFLDSDRHQGSFFFIFIGVLYHFHPDDFDVLNTGTFLLFFHLFAMVPRWNSGGLLFRERVLYIVFLFCFFYRRLRVVVKATIR